MKRPSAMGFALLTLAVASWSRPATAQHHPAAVHPAGGGHVPQVMPHPGGGVSPQMHQQMQQHMQMMMMQEQMRQHQMLQMHHQMHEEHMQRFQEWAAKNGGESAQGKGASKLPDSPEGLQMWMRAQKDNKVHNRSYDPRYDQYVGFMRGNQHHGQANQGHVRENAESQAKASSGHDPGRQPTPGAHAARAEGDGGGDRKNAKAEHSEATKAGEAAHKGSARGEHLRGLAHVGAGRVVLPQDQVSVSLLRTAHMRLQRADADYDGHRVQALHHITAALQRLGSTNVPVATGGASGAGTVAQSVSDGILRDAMLKLQDVQGRLSSPAAVAPHHADARNAVSEAVRELNTALNIR